jgi:uncharacterized protein
MSGREGSTARRAAAFDAWDLASRRASLSGSVAAGALPRVADRIASDAPDAELRWRIDGVADAVGRPALSIALDGSVALECQRCMRTFAWPVRQQTLVLLAKDEREQVRLDEDDCHEVILAADVLEPMPLVEDELLLTLPFAPHCGRVDCVVQAEAKAVPAEADRASPFAALAALKDDPRKKPR